MIDHMTLHVSNLHRSAEFYSRLLGPLGYERKFNTDDVVSFKERGSAGDPGGDLWLSPSEAPLAPRHLAFHAGTTRDVQEFHRCGLAAGGRDNGAPGPRTYHPGYYACFILDPDGNNIEAVMHDYSPNGSASGSL